MVFIIAYFSAAPVHGLNSNHLVNSMIVDGVLHDGKVQH